jgi:fluoroquinolone transport system ATP-binding protein
MPIEPGAAREPVIEVRSLRFTYPGAREPAVPDVSFSVMAGEIFGFLGPSGAGKSTTQSLLIRLLDGHQGAAVVLGKDVGVPRTTEGSASPSKHRTTT